uniref:RecA family profile 1 domain-containing protein n=1 Tax=Heterosigma akashiwo TaxID=2829 RepID=A0A7S3UQA7_HETAK
MAGRIAAGTGEANDTTVVYCSGEESTAQVASRARRLGITTPNLLLLSETDADAIVDQVAYMHPRPVAVVVDSIQTMRAPGVPSQSGTVTQVKECGIRFLHLAKTCNIAVFLVGHVTKSGDFAGPKILEHMVDTVLYMEGEKYSMYRLLRSVKNRYGASNEIGVFEMTSNGMQPVSNPSVLFVSQTPDEDTGEPMDGSSVAVVLEGSRPLVVEIQSLVSHTRQFPPRRAFEGVGYQRGLLLLAVLERRVGLPMQGREVYVNVVGGLKLQETAADLSIIAAIVSSATTTPILGKTALVGEVGLGGELRIVPQIERRIVEAAKFGFERVIVPSGTKLLGFRQIKGNLFALENSVSDLSSEIQIIRCSRVTAALSAAGLEDVVKKGKTRKLKKWESDNQ